MVPELRSGAVRRLSKFGVEVGKFYQISHDNLPPRTPSWLKSIQVVLVSEKTNLKVTVKFPSLESLKKASLSLGRTTGFFPLLDMSFIMGTELAQRVLLWQVVAKRDFERFEDFTAFWLLDSSLLAAPKVELVEEEVSPKYLCSSTIEYEEEALNEVDKNEVLALVKVENDGGGFGAEDLPQRKKFKWWSEKSFEDGKGVILSILKEKKATSDNPISRAALRREAQKEKIGNTGLLDHILKDIPGSLSPDGILRFQRGFNAAGVMVYWLESSDLVDIRKRAGVTDPFWVPPSARCICSEELELVKEDLANIKRELEETKKQVDEIRAAGDVRRYSESSECCEWVGGFW